MSYATGRANGRLSTRQRDVILVCLGSVNFSPQFLTNQKLEVVACDSYSELEGVLATLLDRGVHNSAYKSGYVVTLPNLTPSRIYTLRKLLQEFHLDIDLFIAGQGADATTVSWLKEDCSVESKFLPGVRLCAPDGTLLPPVQQELVVFSRSTVDTHPDQMEMVNSERDKVVMQMMTLHQFQRRTPLLTGYEYLHMPFIADFRLYEDMLPQVNTRNGSSYVVRLRAMPQLAVAVIVNGWHQIELFDATGEIDVASLPMGTLIPTTIVPDDHLEIAAPAVVVP